MLIGWCWFAGAVLIVSLAVHVSTFLGIDPMAKWPGLPFMHAATFLPFIAGIIYAKRVGGPEQAGQDRVINGVPRWLQILTGLFFAYALVNGALFMVLKEGGGPSERDGKYFLTSHGKVLRELSEAEYHRQRGYEIRGCSGHWMMFSSAGLLGLVGAARLRRRSAGTPDLTSTTGTGPGAVPSPPANAAEQAETGDGADGPPQPATVRAGICSLVVYVACLVLIFSGRPALGMVAVPPVLLATMLAVRGGFARGGFQSCLGCLAVFPNALVASVMGNRAAEFIYLAIYLGLGPALSHEVAVTFPKEGPAQLSNGELLHTRVWATLMTFVSFPLFAAGTVGLTALAEHVGRLVEVRRRPAPPAHRREPGVDGWVPNASGKGD